MKVIRRDNLIGQALLEWWGELENRRGDRAVLRRAHDITVVTVSSPYQRGARRLMAMGLETDAAWQRDRLAAALGLVAHVRDDSQDSVPVRLSRRAEGGERPMVSPLRFTRLLESPDIESLYTGLRRTLPMVGHCISVIDLANDVLHWGDGVKKRWAYDYDWPADRAA